jgi:glycosyltransferase 2 family protein
MHKTVKQLLQYSFFLGIGVFLTYWQYNKMTAVQKDFFVDSIKTANYIYLIPVFIMAIISHISRSIRWRYLMKPMGCTPKLSDTFAIVMIGYLVNSLVPRAGEIAKCTLLGKKEDKPVDKLIGTVLIERAIDLLCYAAVIIVTVILQFDRIKVIATKLFTTALEKGGMHPLLKTFLYIIGIILIIMVIKWLIHKFRANIIIQKIKKILLGVKDGFQSIKKLENKKYFWFHTIIIWVCYLMQIFVGFKAMSFTQHLGIDAAFAVLTMGTLAMIVTPGGIGSFPIAVATVLAVYNIDEIAAESFGWVMWGATTSIILVVGIISFIWFEINKNKKNEKPAIHQS